MEAVFEGRDDAEVPPTAAHPPEEIRVLGGAGGQEAPIRSDEIDGEEIITREPVFPGQPAQAPAQREARDARRGVRAAGGGQTKRLGFVIEFAPCDPAFRTGRPSRGSTRTLFIPDKSIMRPPSHTALPGTLWPPPRTDTSRRWVRAKCTALMTSATPRAADNQRGPFVDHAIPDLAGCVIAGVAREDKGAAQTSPEVLKSRFVKDRLHGHDLLISHHCPLFIVCR